jgi:hypothetical protein
MHPGTLHVPIGGQSRDALASSRQEEVRFASGLTRSQRCRVSEQRAIDSTVKPLEVETLSIDRVAFESVELGKGARFDVASRVIFRPLPRGMQVLQTPLMQDRQ